MSLVRMATLADLTEVLRLRDLMHSGFDTPPAEDKADWREPARAMLTERLSADRPDIGVFVIDADEPGTLASCAVGLLQQRNPGPRDPTGLTGYVSNVCTDVRYRRRGCSRACMVALLDWFRDRGAGRADLRSSAQAEPMYTALGFRRTDDPSMVLRL